MSIPPIQPNLDYYLARLTSQYQTPSSPNLQSFAALLLQPFLDTAACADSMNAAFALSTPPAGAQLDVLGSFVGASRTLPFNPTGSIDGLTPDAFGSGYSSGDVMDIVQGGASGGQVVYLVISGISHYLVANPGFGYTAATGLATTGGHGSGLTVTITVDTPSQVLDDADYLTLILAKIAQNQWDGQAGSLWATWQQLFPGGHIYITDNQDMTCTVFITGNFSTVQKQMILNDLIVPRPEAVQYNYAFGLLPAFGFDGTNPALVAGFDVGYWS
jgi:hypothetical protein